MASWALDIALLAFLSRACQGRGLRGVTGAPEYLLCRLLKSQGQVLGFCHRSPPVSTEPELWEKAEGIEEGRNHSYRKYPLNGVQSGGGKVKEQQQNLVSTLCEPDSMNE